MFPPIARPVRSSRLMNNLVNLFVFLFNKLVRLGKFSKGVSLLSKETLGKPFSAAIILFGYLYNFRSFFYGFLALNALFLFG